MGRNQIGHVSMELSQGLIERRETSGTATRQLSEVCIGDLAVADDSGGWQVRVGDIIRPEFMPWISGNATEDRAGRLRGLTFAYQKPHQAALGNGTGSEALPMAGEPRLSRRVMNMIVHHQSDQHVCIQQDGHGSSSSSARTSSVVIVRPR